MTTQPTDDLPHFPAPAPPELADPAEVSRLVLPVLGALAEVVQVPAASTGHATPCRDYTVGQLRDHVLGWVQHFAQALDDPQRLRPRPDPDAYRAAADDRQPGDVVRGSAQTIAAALDGDVLSGRVVMSAATMDGPAAVGMLLGEYLVHGWDLARATGRPWRPEAPACETALAFFRGVITPEYRGPQGFFDTEFDVPGDAPPLDRLLGFAGRDPGWQPNS